VVSLADCVRYSRREHKVQVVELITAVNAACNKLLFMQLLKSVIGLSLTNRVEEDLDIWVNSLTNVLLPHLFGQELHPCANLWGDVVSV